MKTRVEQCAHCHRFNCLCPPIEQAPDPESNRSHRRATALTYLRGCDPTNPCWSDCYDAAFYTITEYGMDEWERENIGHVMAEVYGPKESK